MTKHWTDGYGVKWRKIRTWGGGSVRIRDEVDHEDVQLEQKEIHAERKTVKTFFWPMVVFIFCVNAGILSALVDMAMWIFSGANLAVFVTVICTAYAIAIITVTANSINARVERMELHALTVQAGTRL